MIGNVNEFLTRRIERFKRWVRNEMHGVSNVIVDTPCMVETQCIASLPNIHFLFFHIPS
jgi:hypothetical protein